MAVYFGIDYSMTSPAVVAINEKREILGVQCFSSKKRDMKIQHDVVSVIPYPTDYENNIERFDMLADYTLDFIRKFHTEDSMVFLEGYAYGSVSSRLFQIAENGGILKLKIIKENIPLCVFPPTQVKKDATGRGTANKIAMYDAFSKLYPNLNLVEMFNSHKTGNPVSDIADATHICLYGISLVESGKIIEYKE